MAEHAKAEWYDNEHSLPDGSYADKNGNFCYVKNGMFHREDGPAIVQLNGTTIWCLDGKKHRDGGPAVESVSGYKAWYKNGVLHRDDGPAVIDSDGTEEWWIDGVKTTKDEVIIVRVESSKKEHVKHIKAEWYGCIYKLNGSYINRSGSVCYVKSGKFHREDGPAVKWNNGDEEWHKDGKLHREDGPAIEMTDGTKEWWIDGKRHREDGPAVALKNGTKKWYKNGKLHRDDGPAVEYKSGTKKWYINGKKHRNDGPAIEWADGYKEFYVNNEPFLEKGYYGKIISMSHRRAESYLNDLSPPDGSYVDKFGNVCHIKNRKLHREDGPAIENADGSKEWYLNGLKCTEKEHREKIICSKRSDDKYKELLMKLMKMR